MTHICPEDLVNLNRLGGGVYECPKCHECFQESYGGVLRPTGRRRMEMSMKRAAMCPYCDSRVAMSQGTLGNHRAVGGVCDGSNRGVVSMDSSGRAVLMAYGDSVKVGDKVRVWMGSLGKDISGVVTELRGNLVIVKDSSGSTDAHDKSEVSKA